MKTEAAPFFVFLFFLLTSVDSTRDASMPIPNVAERNQLFMTDGLDIHELVTIFDNEVSSLENSPTKFSHLCLDISGKAQKVLDDQSLIDELNSLASTVCGIPFSDVQAKQLNEACMTCRSILDQISSELRDTNTKLLIVGSLLKLCDIEAQVLGDQCKQLIFTFGPVVLSIIQKIASMDLCYTLRICSYPENQARNGNLWHSGQA